MQESPIFTRTHDLLLWLIPATIKFPREQRFVLARAVQETALRFHGTLLEAALTKGRGESRALARADVDLARLRAYLRLCRDMELITLAQYKHVAAIVSEVGRLLGGWREKASGGASRTARS